MVILKIFSIFNQKRSEYSFFGLLYTNLYDEAILEHQNKNFLNLKQKEILLHIGKAAINERDLFSKNEFIYHSSKQRTNEANLI